MTTKTNKFSAFISYSRQDSLFVEKLHAELETYTLPKDYISQTSEFTLSNNTIYPVYLDKEEIPTSNDLGAALKNNLDLSEKLILVCTPSSVASKWVNAEVDHFIANSGTENIICVVPISGDDSPRSDPVFPASLVSESHEPSAILLGVVDAENRTNVFLALVAAVCGTNLETLSSRHSRRKKVNRIRTLITSTFLISTVSILALWIYDYFKITNIEVSLSKSIDEPSVAISQWKELTKKRRFLNKNRSLEIAKNSQQKIISSKRNQVLYSGELSVAHEAFSTASFHVDHDPELLNSIHDSASSSDIVFHSNTKNNFSELKIDNVQFETKTFYHGRFLVQNRENNDLEIFSFEKGTPIATIDLKNKKIITTSSNSRWISLLETDSNKLVTIDLFDGVELSSIKLENEIIDSITSDFSDKAVFQLSDNSLIYVNDQGRLSRTNVQFDDEFELLALHSRNAELYVLTQDKQIYLIKADDAELNDRFLRTIDKDNAGDIYVLQGSTLAYLDKSKNTIVVSADSGDEANYSFSRKISKLFPLHANTISLVAFEDGSLSIENFGPKRRKSLDLATTGNEIVFANVSKDTNYFAVANAEGVVHVVDLNTGSVIDAGTVGENILSLEFMPSNTGLYYVYESDGKAYAGNFNFLPYGVDFNLHIEKADWWSRNSEKACRNIAFDPSNELAAIRTSRGLSVVDRKGSLQYSLDNIFKRIPSDFWFSDDSKYLFVAQNGLTILDALTGDQLFTANRRVLKFKKMYESCVDRWRQQVTYDNNIAVVHPFYDDSFYVIDLEDRHAKHTTLDGDFVSISAKQGSGTSLHYLYDDSMYEFDMELNQTAVLPEFQNQFNDHLTLQSTDDFFLSVSIDEKWNVYEKQNYSISASGATTGNIELLACGKSNVLQISNMDSQSYTYAIEHEGTFQFKKNDFKTKLTCDQESGIFNIFDTANSTLYLIQDSQFHEFPIADSLNYTKYQINSDSVLLVTDDQGLSSNNGALNKGTRVRVFSLASSEVIYDQYYQLLDDGRGIKLDSSGESLLINSGMEREFRFTEGYERGSNVNIFDLRYLGTKVVNIPDGTEISIPINFNNSVNSATASGVAENYFMENCRVLSLTYDNRIISWQRSLQCS